MPYRYEQSTQINRQKGSSHPSKYESGILVGTVKSFINGKVVVEVENGCTYNDVSYVGATNTVKLRKGERVLCSFANQKTEELYILGTFTKKVDVFATVLKLNALIDQLTTELNTVRANLVPPLPAINLSSFKQEVPPS